MLLWLARKYIQAAIAIIRLEIRIMAIDTSKLSDAINVLSGNVDKLVALVGDAAGAQTAVDTATNSVSRINDKVVAALPPA